MEYILYTLVLLILLAAGLKFSVHRLTVFEYERGLKYGKGRFKCVLEPGVYWYLPFVTRIEKVDIRPRFTPIAGQEVLSADGITLKVSLAANFEIADPERAINSVQNYQEALYMELQLALREVIGSADIDTVLNNRGDLSQRLHTMTASKAEDIGLRLTSVSIKDIMFPGKLKEMFAQVVNARKEGLAALEKARGETAALRNLANAAKMLESNPNLMHLRLVQALEGASGNTLVLGMPSQSGLVPLRTSREHDLAQGGETSPGEPEQSGE